MLGRIVIPNDIKQDDARNAFSDPLTHFTCVFSALIHDVSHLGVPNAQLVKEKARLAMYYKGKSVAEQNSVDVAWALLMRPEYANLRGAIYSDEVEMNRFRYLMVSAVMATDIFDDELKAVRNLRWERAFSAQSAAAAAAASSPVMMEESAPQHPPPEKAVTSSLKATIVIEHLLQASDLSHTMQHWHVYRKWNEKFFLECAAAFRDGRASKDPAEDWYQGELWFFDQCVIPLAKKLKECGVFGVSSEEYLNYAVKNREEWESRGQELVHEMVEKFNCSLSP